ncbi:hypothetical protein Tco_0888781 [Tanacetum coccineum]
MPCSCDRMGMWDRRENVIVSLVVKWLAFIMAEGEIDNLTVEQYLALTRGNQAPDVVKPEIGGNVNFKIKSQFMRELREDTLSGNKNDDAHEHVERVLDIVSLFNILGVSHDVVMLSVFLITLTGAAKRWVAKQLEEIRNFKQEGDKTLYQAWERYNDLLYKCLTHDINNHQKVNIFYNGLGTLNRQLLDSQGPTVQALTAIQTMADHSQKWHDGSSSRNIESSRNSEGIAAIVNKLENLGQDMEKLKENVQAIQVGCQNCGGAHLDKDFPLKEEAHLSVMDLHIRIDNRSPVGEKRPILEELMNKHWEESTRRRTEMKEWESNFYAMADLGASVNVTPKSIFEHLKLARLKKTDMLVEMADMTKRSPIGIVENVLVKIDKFLFPSDFVVMNMLNTHNETMILRRPFLATIHVEIDVFNKEISLGIRGDKITFDMNKKIHNFTTLIEEIYMINATSNTPSDTSSRVEETDDVHNMNNYCNQEQGRSQEEERRKLGINIEEYDPSMVHVETFKVKRYSFDTGQSFICVTKELMDALPMGRENGSRFWDMIRKEADSGRRIHRKINGIRGLLDSFSCGRKVMYRRNGNGYSLKDKNEAKTDKTKHRIGKSMKK